MALGKNVAWNKKIVPERTSKNAPDACFWAFPEKGVIFDDIPDVNGVATLVGGEMKVVVSKNIEPSGKKEGYRDY